MTVSTSEQAQAPAGSALLQDLLHELENLPPARAAALRVVQLVDDDSSTSAAVARAASIDPALTARMLRMANSAYYGLSGRVASAAFAVTVIGFQTVRSLATMVAAGIAGEGELPPDFWPRGATTAAGASLLARRVGADPAQAFCVGTLHDLGTALLWRHDTVRHTELLAAVTDALPAHVLEDREYGGNHASLAADVLTAWHFPDELCVAIGRHHEAPSPSASPLRRALQGAVALTGLADGTARGSDSFTVASLDAADVRRDEVGMLVEQVRREGAELALSLTDR